MEMNFTQIEDIIRNTLKYLDQTDAIRYLVIAFLVILAMVVCYAIGRRLLKKLTRRIIRRVLKKKRGEEEEAFPLLDTLINRIMKAVSLMIPYQFLHLFGQYEPLVQKIISLVFLVQVVSILDGIISAIIEKSENSRSSTRYPIKSYLQILKLIIFIFGAILFFSIMLNKSPSLILSGLGAMTALLMLIFKDTILSFVAGAQISQNDLFRKGDWIEMPAFGADGDVIDISLNTVTVQNFDKTLVSIPTHQFLSHSFKNWRGMQRARGRRIKRHLLIDQSSITICSPEQIAAFSQFEVLKEYIAKKEKEFDSLYPERKGLVVNRRFQTNIGLFRAYTAIYLRQNAHLRQDLTLMVRQLQPSADKGLPLEIYCFTKTTVWSEYENIQGDIFDHLLAVLPYFGLRVFQRVSHIDSRETQPPPPLPLEEIMQ